MRNSFSEKRAKWLCLSIVLALCLPLLHSGCKGISQEEAVELLRSAYKKMAESSSYRLRLEISYDLPDKSPEEREQLSLYILRPMHMEGEVQQREGSFRQHLKSAEIGKKDEIYVIDGTVYQYSTAAGWTRQEIGSYRLNISNLYYFSAEDFERMLGSIQEVKVVENTAEKVVISCRMDQGYLLSSLDQFKDQYISEKGESVYESLRQMLERTEVRISNYIYRSNNYLQRQELVLSIPDAPILGTIVMEVKTDYYDYELPFDIQLPEEAKKAKPAKPSS